MTTRRTGLRIETYDLGHLKLYRDDLEQIAKAVAKVGSLTIKCGDWEMTDPSDFTANTELPALLPELEIEAKGHSVVSVALGEKGASVTLVEPDTFAEGVLSRIQRVTDARRRRRVIPQFSGITGGEIVGVVSLVGGLIAAFSFLLPGGALLTPIFVLLGIAVLVTTKRTRSSAVLVNAYRRDRPGFWQRTRDDWIIAVVMLLLGGVLGYLVNQIT